MTHFLYPDFKKKALPYSYHGNTKQDRRLYKNGRLSIGGKALDETSLTEAWMKIRVQAVAITQLLVLCLVFYEKIYVK